MQLHDFSAKLQQLWHENFLEGSELGASLVIKHKGSTLAEWHEGYHDKKHQRVWTENTLVPVYSATKALSSACVLTALQAAGLDPDYPMRRIWPQFPANVTIAEALSHQAGLASLDMDCTIDDHQSVKRAIEAQTPAWLPPQHGYHPRSFGAICDELCLRLSSMSVQQFWTRQLQPELEVDCWLDLAQSQHERVATLYPGRAQANKLGTEFYSQFLKAGTPINRAFNNPRGYAAVASMNEPAAWSSGLAAMGAVCSARGLADFYQAAIGCKQGKNLHWQVQNWLLRRRIEGTDRTLCQTTCFGLGVMFEPLSAPLGLFGSSAQAFGHAGAGGSIAYADAKYGYSVAYVMNQMELNVLPERKVQKLTNYINQAMPLLFSKLA